MKKTLFAVCLSAAVMLHTHAFSKTEDFSKADGHTWKGYHEYVKLGFALGFLIGADKAVAELEPYITHSSYEGKKVEELLPIYNITNDRLKTRLDQFYAIPENMSVSIQNAIIIICKELHPVKDRKMIEREAEIQRLPPGKQRIEKVKDYLKSEIQKGEYAHYEVTQDKIIESQTKKEVPLKTDEEVSNLWFKMLVPGQGVEVKEVVKRDYSLAVGIGAASLMAIVALSILLWRKSKPKTTRMR